MDEAQDDTKEGELKQAGDALNHDPCRYRWDLIFCRFCQCNIRGEKEAKAEGDYQAKPHGSLFWGKEVQPGGHDAALYKHCEKPRGENRLRSQKADRSIMVDIDDHVG